VPKGEGGGITGEEELGGGGEVISVEALVGVEEALRGRFGVRGTECVGGS
jgi:hypothetical protein